MSRQGLKNVARLIDMETREIPIEEQFLGDLKRSIELQDAKHRRPGSRTFKPSSMNCRRGNYYQLIGEKPDTGEVTYNFVNICNSGSDIHERIQTSISKMVDNGMDCAWVDVGKYVQSRGLDDVEVVSQMGMETKLYNKRYNMSFMCDGIIRYKNKYYIVEIKTESSHKWYNRTSVDKKHHRQAISYSCSLGIDTVIFLYIDRDLLNMKAIRFDVDDAMKQELIDYINEVQGYVDRQIVPPKPDNIEKRICQYCGFQKLCRKEN